MKVLQITHMSASLIHKDYNDAVIRSWNSKVAQKLKKYNPEIDVECWAQERKLKRERTFSKNKIKYRVFPTTFSLKFSFEFSIPLLKALRKEKKAILHLHGCYTLLTYLICLLYGKRQPIVIQNHGDRHPLGHFKRYPWLKLLFPVLWIFEQFAKFCLKRADVFFVNSKKEKDFLRSVTNAKVEIQGMGVSDELFPKISKKKAKKELGLKKKTILFVGTLKKNKGAHHLIKAMEGINAELVIAGKGSYEQELKKTAKKYFPNTKFPGYIQGRKKKLYLSAADVFVLPSYTEGRPVSVMEALSYKIPVVATNAGGIPKLVNEGKNGFLIPVKNEKILSKKIQKALNYDFRDFSGNFRWKKIIENTINHYKIVYKSYFG